MTEQLAWRKPRNVVAERSPRVDMVARRLKQARLRLQSLMIYANPSWVQSPEFPRPLYLNMPKALIPKTQKEFEDLDQALTSLHRWTAVAAALLQTYKPEQAEHKMLTAALNIGNRNA